MTGEPLAKHMTKTQQHACLSQGFFQCWACLFDDSFGTCLQHFFLNSSTASTSKQHFLPCRKQNINPPINNNQQSEISDQVQTSITMNVKNSNPLVIQNQGAPALLCEQVDRSIFQPARSPHVAMHMFPYSDPGN